MKFFGLTLFLTANAFGWGGSPDASPEVTEAFCRADSAMRACRSYRSRNTEAATLLPAIDRIRREISMLLYKNRKRLGEKEKALEAQMGPRKDAFEWRYQARLFGSAFFEANTKVKDEKVADWMRDRNSELTDIERTFQKAIFEEVSEEEMAQTIQEFEAFKSSLFFPDILVRVALHICAEDIYLLRQLHYEGEEEKTLEALDEYVKAVKPLLPTP